MNDEYQFLQFHMHWGSNDLEGSEHVLDGIRYPAEVKFFFLLSETQNSSNVVLFVLYSCISSLGTQAGINNRRRLQRRTNSMA